MRLRLELRHATLTAAVLASGLFSSGLRAQSVRPAGVHPGGELATRVATYQDGAGQSYFAASVQAPADKALLKLLGEGPARLSIVVDTSASQSGSFRADQLTVLRGLLANLRPEDRVQLFAADVTAVPLSEMVSAADESKLREAISRLERRLPLGNTNLAQALQTARGGLVAGPSDQTRSLVYLGDAASIGLVADESKFESLVNRLRSDRISVHGVAIGPTKNVELLATLANQTGGELGVIGDDDSQHAEQIGGRLAAAATLSPIWVERLTLPGGMTVIQDGRLPPLRADRDSLYFGSVAAAADDSLPTAGPIAVVGNTGRGEITLNGEIAIEANHPDFAFLPRLISLATSNDGLLLPTAGSTYLRELVQVMLSRAEELTAAGELALMTGSQRGAEAIADLALENDPHNAAARRLQRRAAGERLVVQNEQDPFGDLFDDTPAETAGEAAAPVAEPVAPQAPPPAPVAPAPNRRDAGAAPAGAAGRVPAPPAPDRGARRMPPPPRDDDLLEQPSGILGDTAAARDRAQGRLKSEVRAQLLDARRRLETNPIGVSGTLKALLVQVENQPDVDPQLRQELAGQVRSAIQSASRREASAIEAEATAAQIAAAATQTELLLQETFRREDQIKTLSNQLNSLIEEGRLRYADAEVIPAIEELAKDTVFSNQALLKTQMLNSATRMLDIRLRRRKNYLDAFALVEEANIPFVDDLPVQYPDAETWRRMSRRRLGKYGSVELLGDGEAERQINLALNEEVSYDFIEETLENAVRLIAEDQGINFRIDEAALRDTTVTLDEPINLTLSGITLRAFIREMIDPFEDLTYDIQNSVLKITSIEKAESKPRAKIYAVGDLTIPPMPPMMGGMMGGMGGGMMGGMGGGMGGMGGGMGGGMMGGMGGMGGGMMGGMMAVPDDVSLANKAAADRPADTATPAVDPASVHRRIEPSGATAPVSFDAWREYFDSLELSDSAAINLHDQRVLATAGYFNKKIARAESAGDQATAKVHFAELRDFVGAAILTGHVQHWMHLSYALALRATDGDRDEIERALLSAVDFADSPEEVLMVADHLRRIGFEASALRLCRDVSAAQPYRREPYMMGIRLAERLDDLDALQWACRGILSQAWPKGAEKFESDARLLARATHQMLVEQGRQDEASRFLSDLQQATAHDLVIRVSWTGDADIDIAVEEPSGTVCHSQQPYSPAGGTFLGDTFPGLESTEEDGMMSETYLCPQGFSGVYQLLIRRVWGNVTSGHVTVDILSDIGRPTQRYIRQQIELTEKDALVKVEVKQGARKAEVAEAQLAHLNDMQQAEMPRFLAQFMGGDAAVMDQFLNDVASMQSIGGRGLGGPFGVPGFGPLGFGVNPAVGFRPEIDVIPEGAMLMTNAVLSADRRYVQVGPMPMFSQILEVNTFNFVDGDTGDAGGIGGGAGGIGGGMGGGMGGLGGGMGGMGGGMGGMGGFGN